MSLVEKFLSDEDDLLLRRASLVDKIDRILGPFESALQIYGGEQGVFFGNLLSVLELVCLKAPFVYSYLRRTGDYDALVSWVPKEIFAYMVNFGDFIDLHNSYKNRVRTFYESRVEKGF